MTLTLIATFITEVGVLWGVVRWVAKKYKKAAEKTELTSEGIKCLLRNEMLQIYYRHKDTETIRQYEFENFIMLFKAYKALGGNSFIDKIYEEVKTWEVNT
jgi:hypothetical protein